MNYLMNKISPARLSTMLALTMCILATGCSTTTVSKIKDKADKTIDAIAVKTNIGQNPRDPLEGYNRVMYNFNDSVDRAVLKPVAQVYHDCFAFFCTNRGWQFLWEYRRYLERLQ